MLLEVIGPEIQTLYDDRQIEIELVDVHFGTGPTESAVDVNPRLLADYLTEIACCKRESKSVFFIVSDYMTMSQVLNHIVLYAKRFINNFKYFNIIFYFRYFWDRL